MINLEFIPNANTVDTSSENANGALIAQLIIFYIGVIAFIIVCCIPPFTLCLPFIVPVVVLIILFVNLSYFGKFLDSAGNTFKSIVNNTNAV